MLNEVKQKYMSDKKTKNFNIYSFDINSYKDENFYKKCEENYFFKSFDYVTDYNFYKDLFKHMNKYFVEGNNKKSTKFIIDDNVKKILKKGSDTSCTLKNRILSDSVKNTYLVKDHLNFISFEITENNENEERNIFQGIRYKDIERLRKMLYILSYISFIFNRNPSGKAYNFAIDLLNHTRGYDSKEYNEIYKLYSYFCNNHSTKDSLDFIEFINKIKSDILKKYDTTNELKALSLISTQLGFTEKIIQEIRSSDNFIWSRNIFRNDYSYYDNVSNLFSIAFTNSVMQFSNNYDSIPNNMEFVRLIKLLINKDKYSFNRIFNNVFQYSDFINNILNKKSYVKKEKVLNKFSQTMMETSKRISINPEDQEQIDKLSKSLKELVRFQESTANYLTLFIKEYFQKNNYLFKEVSGKEIPYYYNVANYLDTGITHSLFIKNNQLADSFARGLSALPNYRNISMKEGELFGSCMRYPQTFGKVSWYRYNSKVSMLIYTNENGSVIQGRALVWNCNGKKYVDRFFANSQLVKDKFAQFMNESVEYLPLFEYQGINSNKKKEYEYINNNISSLIYFDLSDIRLFNSIPYFDTFRRYCLHYDKDKNRFYPKEKRNSNEVYFRESFTESTDYSITKDDNNTIALDSIRIRTFSNSKQAVKCDICKRQSVETISIKGIDGITKCCKTHIKYIPSISNDRMLLYNSRIYNVEKNKDSLYLKRYKDKKISIITGSSKHLSNILKNENLISFKFSKNDAEEVLSSHTCWHSYEDPENTESFSKNYVFFTGSGYFYSIEDIMKMNNDDKIIIKTYLKKYIMHFFNNYYSYFNNFCNIYDINVKKKDQLKDRHFDLSGINIKYLKNKGYRYIFNKDLKDKTYKIRNHFYLTSSSIKELKIVKDIKNDDYVYGDTLSLIVKINSRGYNEEIERLRFFELSNINKEYIKKIYDSKFIEESEYNNVLKIIDFYESIKDDSDFNDNIEVNLQTFENIVVKKKDDNKIVEDKIVENKKDSFADLIYDQLINNARSQLYGYTNNGSHGI